MNITKFNNTISKVVNVTVQNTTLEFTSQDFRNLISDYLRFYSMDISIENLKYNELNFNISLLGTSQKINITINPASVANFIKDQNYSFVYEKVGKTIVNFTGMSNMYSCGIGEDSTETNAACCESINKTVIGVRFHFEFELGNPTTETNT